METEIETAARINGMTVEVETIIANLLKYQRTEPCKILQFPRQTKNPPQQWTQAQLF